MGLNQCKIVNESGKIFHIITFNNSDTLYWYYREFCQPPANGEELSVDGLPGGLAVKVGVVYNDAGGRIIYDLFKVNHGATLTIQEVSQENGVESFTETKEVERLRRGRSIKMSADHAEGVGNLLQTAGQFSGAVTIGVAGAKFVGGKIFQMHVKPLNSSTD